MLGEQLPLSAVFKDTTRLKQIVRVFRNPQNNNKRIVLNSSSKFGRVSALKETRPGNNLSWIKEKDSRSVPPKKKTFIFSNENSNFEEGFSSKTTFCFCKYPLY